MNNSIFRSRTNKVIAGICGGLGEKFNIDPVIFRILFVVSIFAGGIGFILYVIGWIIIPMKPSDSNFITEGNTSNPSQDAGVQTEFENVDFENQSSEQNNNSKAHKKGDVKNFPQQVKSATTTTAIVVGIVFILIGASIMLYKLDIITWRFSFFQFLSYWPLGLVIIGCCLIPMHKLLRTIIVVLIFGLWIGLCSFGEKGSRLFSSTTRTETIECMETNEDTLSVPYNSAIHFAECEVELNASNNTLTTTKDQILQFNWNATDKRPAYRLTNTKDDGIYSYKIAPKKSFHASNMRTTLMLNPDIRWQLDIESNASELDYDLSPFFIEKLSLESNASNVVLTFGDKASFCNVKIEGNASSLTLRIPKESGCRLYSESTLTNIETTDFISNDKHQSESSNYTTAVKKINIELESNLGNVIIEQY